MTHDCADCRHVGWHRRGTTSERLICRRAPYQRTAVFERDSIPEPQRKPGDKCGPEGRHWEAPE